MCMSKEVILVFTKVIENIVYIYIIYSIDPEKS